MLILINTACHTVLGHTLQNVVTCLNSLCLDHDESPEVVDYSTGFK